MPVRMAMLSALFTKTWKAPFFQPLLFTAKTKSMSLLLLLHSYLSAHNHVFIVSESLLLLPTLVTSSFFQIAHSFYHYLRCLIFQECVSFISDRVHVNFGQKPFTFDLKVIHKSFCFFIIHPSVNMLVRCYNTVMLILVFTFLFAPFGNLLCIFFKPPAQM